MTDAQKLDASETTWIEKHDHEHGEDDDELDDDDNDDSGYDPDSNKTKIWNLRQVMAMTSPQVLPILWRKTVCDELICVALLSKWTMLFIVVFDDGWYRIIST